MDAFEADYFDGSQTHESLKQIPRLISFVLFILCVHHHVGLKMISTLVSLNNKVLIQSISPIKIFIALNTPFLPISPLVGQPLV